MGSRANAVVIQEGRRHVYYAHWAAQYMDALMFWGPEHALAEIREWRDGREDDPESDVEWWLDDAWAEGGCCIDLDKRHLILYGGEDIECDVLWLETYMKLLPYTWRGWTTEWSWGELSQIARYAGVTGAQLEEISCSRKGAIPDDRDWYIDTFLECSTKQRPTSTVAIRRNGTVRSIYTSESEPEVLLDLEGDIERVIEKMSPRSLDYDDDEFLMGSLFLDYDSHEIWLWHMWNNNLEIDLPAYWTGWKQHDCKYRYDTFFESVPHFIDFVPRSENVYLSKIGGWVCKDRESLAPHGLPTKERSAIFEDVLTRYRADNPTPRQLP